ncbi:unnamed protein product [Dibothriocephalus latus]|uniref:Uncharacterized protein n=1 Tax=Dibothriocephalus latus TaxID=60516 RepID=A0A3P7R8D6_DIBLA|nr:unnamed protein product [Dibothriocephalus latus]
MAGAIDDRYRPPKWQETAQNRSSETLFGNIEVYDPMLVDDYEVNGKGHATDLHPFSPISM